MGSPAAAVFRRRGGGERLDAGERIDVSGEEGRSQPRIFRLGDPHAVPAHGVHRRAYAVDRGEALAAAVDLGPRLVGEEFQRTAVEQGQRFQVPPGERLGEVGVERPGARRRAHVLFDRRHLEAEILLGAAGGVQVQVLVHDIPETLGSGRDRVYAGLQGEEPVITVAVADRRVLLSGACFRGRHPHAREGIAGGVPDDAFQAQRTRLRLRRTNADGQGHDGENQPDNRSIGKPRHPSPPRENFAPRGSLAVLQPSTGPSIVALTALFVDNCQ